MINSLIGSSPFSSNQPEKIKVILPDLLQNKFSKINQYLHHKLIIRGTVQI